MLGNMGDNPFTRKAWNDIIDLVNLIASEPPQDTNCSPLEPLEQVPPEHIWTTGDVKAVQDKLMEICDENTFDDELTLWRDRIIEEIFTAMEQGWCHCDPKTCYAEAYTTIIKMGAIPMMEYIVLPLPGPAPEPPPPEHFDYYSVGTSITGFGKGIGGTISIERWDGQWQTVYANSFDCSGNQKQPLPQPSYDEQGNLAHSTVSGNTVVYLRCSLPEGYNVFGFPGCNWGDCSEPPDPPPVYHYPDWRIPDCPGEVDEAYVKERNGAVDGPSGGAQTIFLLVVTPDGAWAGGLPCRRCCADRIGFCGLDCDPTRVPCVDEEDSAE
jgi:hypothetical protein